MMERLRPVTADDARLVFAWRNDPQIIAVGTLQRSVTWDEHEEWFKETVGGERRKMFIVQEGDEPIGQVRFERMDGGQCAISVYLLEKFTGKGLGVDAIRYGCWEICRHWNIQKIVACVRSDNKHARSAFLKAGFLEQPGASACPGGHAELVFSSTAAVPHNRLSFGEEAARDVAGVVASGWVAAGPKVLRLEEELARASGRRFAVCVGSGLGALRLALRALGIGPGDEVIVPAYSCVALPNAVLTTGAAPVPVEVTRGEWNLDPRAVSKAVTARTKAVIAVHTFGLIARVPQLRHDDIPVIEDCAHAFGISVDGKPVGSLGAIAVSSFYATKLVGGGEGGAVFTDKNEIAEFVGQSRNYDEQAPSGLCLKDKMNDMEAALALNQVRQLPSILKRRREIAQCYDEMLRPLAEATGLFRVPDPSSERVWYRYAMEMASADAERVIDELKRYGIDAQKPVTDWRPEMERASCPVANQAYASLVSLPLYPTLTADEQQRVWYAFSAVVRRLPGSARVS